MLMDNKSSVENLATSHVAFLSSKDGYTVFRYENLIVRFLAPYSLENYTEVKLWEKGYIEVMAKYSHNKELEEEYIDLKPIFEDLYLPEDIILDKIKEVRVCYD